MAQKYEVTAPDGAVYEVEAPQGATEADILAQVQGASEARKPRLGAADEKAYAALASDPRTTPKQLRSFVSQRGMSITDSDLRAFFNARKKARVSSKVVYKGELPAAPPSSLHQNIGAAIGQAVDTVIPGLTSNIRGGLKVAGNAIEAARGNEEFDPSGAMQEGEAEQEYAKALFNEQHPVLSTGAQVSGVLASLALPEARVFRGSGLLPGMGNAAVTASAYGAAGGALNDTGDGRMANALRGGAFGAVEGAAIPAALRGAASTASAVRRNIPGMDATARFLENIPRRATGRPLAQPGDAARAQGERILAEELDNATIATGMGAGDVPATPAAIEAEVGRRAGLGVPAMPADVTEPGRRITSWALQGKGPMASRARSALASRQASSGTRVRGHITGELGGTVDPIAEPDRIRRQSLDNARPLYEQAYQLPLQITPDMVRISRTPAFQDALRTATRNIQNDMRDPRAMGFILDDAGNVVRGPVNDISVEGMDQVIRAMGDDARAAADRHPHTGQPVNNTNSVHIDQRRAELRDLLAQQNEPYRQVTQQYADDMALRDAMRDGLEVAGLTGPEIAAQARRYPQRDARDSWSAGASTALADTATQASLRPTANVAQRVRQAAGLSGAGSAAAAGDLDKVGAIETMVGRTGALRRLDERLEAEDQAFKTFNEVTGNSKTQPRQALDEALSADAIGTAGRVARGDVVGAITSVLFRGNPRGTMRFKQDVQDRIAELMTSTGAQDVGTAMRAIMSRAQQDADFADLLNRAGIKPAKLIALAASGQDTTPLDEQRRESIAPPAYSRINP